MVGTPTGVLTALLLPVHLSRRRLAALLTEPPPSARGAAPDVAVRAGHAALRGLARLRTPYWRNTCLYRSALRCVLLRRAGFPAVLRIGARRGDTESSGIAAHAWVEVDGSAVGDEHSLDGFTQLRGREIDPGEDTAARAASHPYQRSRPTS